MSVKINLIGRHFDRLKVIKELPSTSGNSYWLCECKCGNTCRVRGQNLIKGITKSCGCLRTEKTIERSTSKNTYKKCGEYTYVYDNLGNKCIIDTEDLEKVKPYYWSKSDEYWISQRRELQNSRLHRFILDFPNSEDVDHIDGDTDNNRKCNLRPCSHRNNSLNHRVASNNTTGVTGVVYVKRTGKYMARIKVKGKDIFLGYYQTLEEASKVRKEAEIKYFKEYRRIK